MKNYEKIKQLFIENKYSHNPIYKSVYLVWRFQYFAKGYARSLFEVKREIPRRDEFTMGGAMKVAHWYIDNSYAPTEPLVYTSAQVESYIADYIQKGRVHYYGQTDLWLYQALAKYSLRDRKVAIIGSVTPYYESMVLHYGGKPVTIEYNPIIMEDERLSYVSAQEFQKSDTQYDAAFSISSYEHDGLGRYGDPINPNADLEAIALMKKRLTKGGLLFLVLPVGQDTLVWNAHRIYGPVRLPLMLDGWELVESFGFTERMFRQWNCNGRRTFQPVFVLRKIED